LNKNKSPGSHTLPSLSFLVSLLDLYPKSECFRFLRVDDLAIPSDKFSEDQKVGLTVFVFNHGFITPPFSHYKSVSYS